MIRASAALVAAPAAAQPPPAGERPAENLQVLPKTRSRDSVTAIMRAMSAALGVRCTHCHVGAAGGQGPPRLALDVRRERQVARFMSDFGELPVNDLARRLADAGRTADALALLRMNQEHHPSSPDVDFLLGETHLKRGARDHALTRFRAVRPKRPNDQRAQRRVREPGGG